MRAEPDQTSRGDLTKGILSDLNSPVVQLVPSPKGLPVMRRARPLHASLLHLLLLWMLLALSGCGSSSGGPVSPNLPALSAGDLAVAQQLQTALALPSTATVLLRPVAAGTLIQDVGPVGDPPVSLTVPNDGASYFGAVIDYEPGHRLTHAFKLAYIAVSGGNVTTADSEWGGRFFPPTATPVPYTKSAQGVVNGVVFTSVTGDGAPVIHDASRKTAVPPYAATGQALGDHSGEAAPSDCSKIALVCDFGDIDQDTADSLDRDRVADKFASDADKFSQFVRDGGFTVKRISQSFKNQHQTLFPTHITQPDTLGDHFRDVLRDYATKFDCLDDDCCHEFFLYIGGHASTRGLGLYSADGKSHTSFPWVSLYSELSNFPKCVKIIVFLDTCHSESSFTQLQKLCQDQEGNKRCGLTLVAACSTNETALAGSFFGPDSATERFMKEAGDPDNDGKQNDFQDRYIKMQQYGVDHGIHPKRYLCPGQTKMCSTD